MTATLFGLPVVETSALDAPDAEPLRMGDLGAYVRFRVSPRATCAYCEYYPAVATRGGKPCCATCKPPKVKR